MLRIKERNLETNNKIEIKRNDQLFRKNPLGFLDRYPQCYKLGPMRFLPKMYPGRDTTVRS